MKSEEIFKPYFEYVADWAEKQLEDLGIKNGKIMDSLTIQITEKCMWIPLRCLIFEMHELKEKGMLFGKDSVQMYESYLDNYLSDAAYLCWFENKYPLIRKFIDKKILDSVRFTDEVTKRLKQDKSMIVKELCDGKEFNAINDMQLYLSDEHISGQTVVRISLDNGCAVYYKPKDLSVCRYYQQVYAWLMGQCGEKVFPYPQICGKTYGWEKEIVRKPCSCKREVEKYYENIGMHLCVAYVLGVTDIHFENVIAHGEYPIITDIEFLANTGCSAFTEKENLQDYLSDNVLSTGLLPVNAWLGKGGNASGIGDAEKQCVPVKMPILLNKGTAEMAIGYDYPKMKPGKNIPILNGEKCCYKEYIRQITEGFERGYTCILENKSIFLKKFQYGFRYASRVLLRNTQEYFMYGNILNFPELMQDETRRRHVLEHMGKGLMCSEKYRDDILEYEMESVYKGVIPVFHIENRNLITGNGEVFDNYYSCSIEERLIKHIRKLSEKNGELQKRIIHVQLYNCLKREEAGAVYDAYMLPALRQLTPKRIADYFVQNVWNINGKCEWITLQYLETDICLGAADDYLYGGISGAAVFFAALNKKYNDPVYQLIFEKIVCQIKLHTESDAKMGDVCGLFTGEASLIYTYLLLYKITEDDSYLIYAQKQADKMMESDAFKIDGDDLLSGKAGVIIAYLELYGVTDSRKYLEFAIIIGDLLLNGAGKREKGIGWFNSGQSNLAGMAHGNSGIALAIAFLWKYCKSEKYIHYIKAAIDYEDTLYDAKLCNWLDIRECDRYGEGKDMAAWCHGCGGIYLARKRIHELTGIPLEELFYVFAPNKEDYDTCLGKKLFAAKKENSCLCHGSLGIYALLKQIDVEEYREEIKNQCLSFEDMNNIGFMNGIAGIGYVLLDEDNLKLPGVLGLNMSIEV